MRLLFSVALMCCCAAADSAWTVARSSHFEVYSQAGEGSARTALGWFEELRAFFLRQMMLGIGGTGREADSSPVRVIGFRSVEQFREYCTRPTSDAYYVGSESQDYIVMSRLAADQFSVAAHEYSHAVLHAHGLRLPSWLDEGLAEFLSSVRISSTVSTVGGELPIRTRTLRREWIPLADLFSLTAQSPLRNTRDGASLFYAESWALVHMLVLSPQYGPRFPVFVAALNEGLSSPAALTSVYSKSLDVIAADAHAWIHGWHFAPVRMPGVAASDIVVTVASVLPVRARLLMGEVLFASGELNHAEAVYRELARQAPALAEIPAALGSIALRRGDRERARTEWRRAMDLGIADATLCYRYASLGSDSGLDRDEIRRALERAIELQPEFDDARYTLGLLEMNTGHYDAAVKQLRAIRGVTPARAYGYWTALAYSLNELDLRDDAKAAAAEAARFAASPEERAHASTLGYFADTDLAVRFTRDANGQMQLSTARAPHNQTDWNPFIEPGDRMRRVDATLEEIGCEGTLTRVVVKTAAGGRIELVIADRTHVQMRNAPAEFTCGRQTGQPVMVEYAVSDSVKDSAGVVRGIEFR